MSSINVYPLDKLITSDNNGIKELLSDFFNTFHNEKDKDDKIKKFLVNDSIDYNEHYLAKTYLIIKIDDDKKVLLLGFFTISLKSINVDQLSNSQKKTLLGNVRNRNNIKYAPAYLIAQIGKNDRYNILNKYEIMNECREQIKNAINIVGGRIVILECYDELIDYYKENGFILYSDKNDKKSGLYTMYQRFDKWVPKATDKN